MSKPLDSLSVDALAQEVGSEYVSGHLHGGGRGKGVCASGRRPPARN